LRNSAALSHTNLTQSIGWQTPGICKKIKATAYAAAYVNEALLEGDEVVFKTAVADVIRARGVGKVAEAAGVNRVTVFSTPAVHRCWAIKRSPRLLARFGLSFWKLAQAIVEVQPLRSTAGPFMKSRLNQIWVVECTDGHDQDVRFFEVTTRHRAAATWTETALSRFRRTIINRFTPEPEQVVNSENSVGCKRSARVFLAHPTMAMTHPERGSSGSVSYVPAETSTFKDGISGHSLTLHRTDVSTQSRRSQFIYHRALST